MLKDSDITEKIVGCAITVHNELGCGFQEIIYQRSLAIEFDTIGISAQSEYEMPIRYKGQLVGVRRVDFLVAGKICVELKAVEELANAHLAQARNYLEASYLETGLLINFGSQRLEFKRIFNNKLKK